VCPVQCGHQAAQVKVKTDKATGTAHPYVHCAGCGVQLHTRNDEQARHLLAITRAEKGAQDAPEAPPSAEPAPAGSNPPPEAKKPAGGFLLGGWG
jgi:hypothetical protein